MARLSDSLKMAVDQGREFQALLEELSSQGEAAGTEAERQAQIVFEMLGKFAGQVERISQAGRGLTASAGGRTVASATAPGGLRSPGDRLLGPSETREIGQEIAKEINQGGGTGGGGGGGGDINSFLRLRGGF